MGPVPRVPSDPKPDSGPAATRHDSDRPGRQFPYRKVSEIEADIIEAESRKEDLEELMSDPEIHRDTERMQQVVNDYEIVRDELEMLTTHWEEAIELN